MLFVLCASFRVFCMLLYMYSFLSFRVCILLLFWWNKDTPICTDLRRKQETKRFTWKILYKCKLQTPSLWCEQPRQQTTVICFKAEHTAVRNKLIFYRKHKATRHLTKLLHKFVFTLTSVNSGVTSGIHQLITPDLTWPTLGVYPLGKILNIQPLFCFMWSRYTGITGFTSQPLFRSRHRASTSMYLLTFCVRVMSPERHHWKRAVQAAAVMLRTPPSTASSTRTPRRAFALCRHIAGWTRACN